MQLNISANQYSQLSIDQLTIAISTLNDNITQDTIEIGKLNAEIGLIKGNINEVPGGYQDIYDTAVRENFMNKSNYERVSTSYNRYLKQFSSLQSQISAMRISTADIDSTISSLVKDYDLVNSEYLSTKKMLDIDVSINQSTYNTYIQEYSTISAFNMVSTLVETKTFLLAGGEGLRNTFAYSPDGITWTGLGKSVFNIRVNAIAYSLNMWVAVGYHEGSDQNKQISIAYSEDGINWNQVLDSKITTFEEGLGVAWNGSLWVAVGKGGVGNTAYSSDGKNWTKGTIPLTEVYGITWGGVPPGMWIATGKGVEGLCYGYNGINDWQGGPDTIENGVNVPLFTKAGHAAAWNGTIWIAVGEGTHTMASSTDGTNWIPVANSPFGPNGIGRSITWDNNMWVATGASAERDSSGALEVGVATSTDGVIWTPIKIFETGGGYSATYNGRVWAIAGDDVLRRLYTVKPENFTNGVYEYDEIQGLKLFDTKGITVANRNLQTLCNMTGLDIACNPVSTYGALSTIITSYDITTLNNDYPFISTQLSTIIATSTLYGSGSTISSVHYYSTQIALMLLAKNDIEAYMSTYGSSVNMSFDLTVFNLDLTYYYTELDQYANDFFSNKRLELLSEVEENRYATLEASAFLGVLKSEFNIQKQSINQNINTYSFDIQTAVDAATQNTLIGQRQTLVNTTALIDTEVSIIDSLDDRYALLLQPDGIFDTESKYKAAFIENRSTLHSMERQVLEYPDKKAELQSKYTTTWWQMNTALINANSEITKRTNALSRIKGIVDPVKNDITNNPLLNSGAYPFPSFPEEFRYNTDIITPQNINDTTVLDYSILPYLQFS